MAWTSEDAYGPPLPWGVPPTEPHHHQQGPPGNSPGLRGPGQQGLVRHVFTHVLDAKPCPGRGHHIVRELMRHAGRPDLLSRCWIGELRLDAPQPHGWMQARDQHETIGVTNPRHL